MQQCQVQTKFKLGGHLGFQRSTTCGGSSLEGVHTVEGEGRHICGIVTIGVTLCEAGIDQIDTGIVTGLTISQAHLAEVEDIVLLDELCEDPAQCCTGIEVVVLCQRQR